MVPVVAAIAIAVALAIAVAVIGAAVVGGVMW